MKFPTIIDFDGIEGLVLTEIEQDTIQTMADKTRSYWWTRRSISKSKVHLKSLGSLGKQVLKGGRFNVFRLLFFGTSMGVPRRTVLLQNLGGMLLSFSFLFSLAIGFLRLGGLSFEERVRVQV